jgi:YidC/Oxa1 family membrane protein insertase
MQNNNKNIILAIILSAIILISWTWLYEKPKMVAQSNQAQQRVINTNKNKATTNQGSTNQQPFIASYKSTILPRDEIINQNKQDRIQIQTPELRGSINLKGAIFDDITLVNYQQSLKKNSPDVVLLSPDNTTDKFLVNFGFKPFYEIASGSLLKNIDFPNANTLWKADGNILTPNSPITLSWQNKQNVTFKINVAVDEHYMFNVSQSIENNSSQDISLTLTSKIQRFLSQTNSSSYILHEGPIGVFDGILKETNYTSLTDQKASDENSLYAQNGWIGVTDKYWLVSVIPDKRTGFNTTLSYQNQNPGDLYITDFTSDKFQVKSGTKTSFQQKMFAGAKKVSLLDEYSKQYDIALFDRAVDFGWYYFLTKPFFFILQFFNNIFGNYGLAILSITVLVKLVMFPLANKSYSAIAKIKQLQPKIDKIREQYKDKKMQMNKEIMEMYKKEKVNPVSGCLPMIVQIPVFFSLYKVLYLTIDMRHAPFYGWIKDLSAPDPTSIFNLFGLFPFDTNSILTIGVWPILMGVTMIIQQHLNPKPSDPTQAKVMKILPFILIFVFATFPSGLLIYWTWSNTLSILQQWFITKKLNK